MSSRKHIHIIGVGGTFMAGIATLAQACGYMVTGCDSILYPPMSTQLEDLNIEVHTGYDAEQLAIYTADYYIIGNVARRGMPVIESILNQNLPYISGPQWLAENILKYHHVLAVAGTHGKTTTSSMLAWILQYAGYQPSFLIGGIPQNFGVSAQLTNLDESKKHYFVIEADEYDTAFFDKRSKFVHYRPRTTILNNLEYDHADIFPDIHAIQMQFHHLVRTVPNEGLLVVNYDDIYLQEALDMGCWSPVSYFGTNLGWHYCLSDTSANTFTVYDKTGQAQGEVTWNLSGKHNCMNALSAIIASSHIGISPSVACQALSHFCGVKRRMEVKGSVAGVMVYDDFAHHPTAIATTIEGLRQQGMYQRIIVVLEPRSNTMKMGTLKDRFAHSLQNADSVWCFSQNIDWDIQSVLVSLGSKGHVLADMEELVLEVVSYVHEGDAIVVMSNGSFGGIHQKLLDCLQKKYTN